VGIHEWKNVGMREDVRIKMRISVKGTMKKKKKKYEGCKSVKAEM